VCGLCTILGQRGAGRRRGGFDLLRLLRLLRLRCAAWLDGWLDGRIGRTTGKSVQPGSRILEQLDGGGGDPSPAGRPRPLLYNTRGEIDA
jgi:hypothetical protein